jgi:hypothetical protein
MPETRYHTIETFDGKGNLVKTEQMPYEVSEVELEMEGAEKAVAQLSVLPDAELTTTKLKKLVKALAKLRR